MIARANGRGREHKVRQIKGLEDKGYGGGGSRTRVRKHVVVGLDMRVRVCFLVLRVRTRQKTAEHQPRKISRPRAEAPSWPPACLMAFGPQPPGEVKANVTA